MPGPSTANLSSYAPSRKIFSDASGIINASVAGIGDSNLSTVADIAEGFDKGLSLAAKTNAFIQSISPQAAEERELNLEIKRAQASVSQQQGQVAQIQFEADALNKENILNAKRAEAQRNVYNEKLKNTQVQVLTSAYDNVGKINDIPSFEAYLRDPQFNILRTNPDFQALITGQATKLIGTTNDPQEQIKLAITAEAAAPGSIKSISPLLSSAAQTALADPKTRAEIIKDAAQARQADAAAKKDISETATIDAQNARRAQLASAPPYDPIAAALGTAPRNNGTSPVQPAPALPIPQAPQTGAAATGAGANPAVQQGQQIPVPTQTPSPTDATVDPARQAKVQEAEKILYSEDQKKAVVDRLVVAGEADTPSREMRQMVLDDVAQRNPDLKSEQIASIANAELASLRLQPDEFKERQKLTSAIPQLETALQRIDAALQTVDEYKKVHGDPNLGPSEYFGRQKDILLAKAFGGPDEKKLLDAYAELDASGVNAAMQSIAASGLTGPLTALMSNEQERDVLQSLQTGSNVSEERNRQAREILAAKLHQMKEVVRIVDAHQAAHVGFEDASRAAARWVSANPVTEVGRIDGAPAVVAKKKLPTANDYLFNKLHLEKYVERNKEGRATVPPQTGSASSIVKEIVDLADRKAKGEKIPIPPASDIPDKLNAVSPALFKRMVYQESGFNPNAESSAGAKGLTQLMDKTGKELWEAFNFHEDGAYDPFVPEKNALMGLTYMNQMLKTFNYDTRLALAAYNAGPGRLGDVVKAYKNARHGVGDTSFEAVRNWLPPESRNYVDRIMGTKEDLASEKPSLTTVEYKGAIDSLPTPKAREQADQILSSEGQRALQDTVNIKRVADTKGTILESVVGALWSANPFGATEAQAQEPEEETGSDDSRTRVLNADDTVSVEGLLEPGNIDISKQPEVQNDDGTVSTVRSISFQGVDGKETLIPTVSSDGKILSDKEAISQYRRTGQHLGKFETPDAANAYAEQLHNREAQRIESKPAITTPQSREQAADKPFMEDMEDGLQAVLLGAARGILFGADDEMAALYRMAAHGETWEQATGNARAIRDEIQKASPWLYGTGEIVGGILNPVPGAVFKGAKSVLSSARIIKAAPAATKVGEVLTEQTPSALQMVGKGTGVGAASGFTTGFNEAEGGIDNRINRALTGLVIGGGVGAIAGAIGRQVSRKLSSGQLSKEQIAVLKEWEGMSDAELRDAITKLSSNNPDASFLSEVGIRELREHISQMAKNPKVIDSVTKTAEGQVGREVEAIKNMLNTFTKDVSSEKAAKALTTVVTGQVKEFYKKLHDIGDTVYDKARAAASKNTIMSKGRYARLKKALPADQSHTVPGDKFNIVGQRYEIGFNPSVERPGFVSDEVFKELNSNLVTNYIEKAQKLLEDLEGGLQSNDFSVVTLARSMMRDEADEIGGTAGKILKDAEQRLKKATYNEVPELQAADEAYEAGSKTLRQNYSKGLKKLESYAVDEGVMDSKKIHEDVMKMGSAELKSVLKNLDPADREVFKESARNFITDKLEKRGDWDPGKPTKEFPDFTKDFGSDKLKAIFGDKEGSEIISKLKQQERITRVANSIIREGQSAKNEAIEEGKNVTQRFGIGVAGLATSIANMSIFGVNRYTIAVAGAATLNALDAYIKKGRFNSEKEMAEGIADIIYRQPHLGLDLLEKVSQHVKKDIPEYYPTWAKVAATTAQILVSSGDDREPQTTAREKKKATEITIHYDPKVNAPK